MILGERIAELRKDNGYTQKNLAEFLNISTTSLSNYENGINYPDPFVLLQISDVFNVSVDYLLGKTNMNVEYCTLSQEKIGSLTLPDFNKQILSLDKEHRKMMHQYLDLVMLHYKVNAKHK